jgi:hypothetical protein
MQPGRLLQFAMVAITCFTIFTAGSGWEQWRSEGASYSSPPEWPELHVSSARSSVSEQYYVRDIQELYHFVPGKPEVSSANGGIRTAQIFAVTDAAIEAMIRIRPIHEFENVPRADVFTVWSLPEDKLTGHSSMWGGRLNMECWQVSPTYWLLMSYDFASPERVRLSFHPIKPLF